MSVHDAYQSRFCSFRNVGLAKTNYLGDDDTLMRFSPYREEELKEMLSRIPDDMRHELDQWIRIFVKEVIELAHKNQSTTSMHGVGDFELRSSELRFSDNIASPLLTGDHIKGTGGMPIKVSLVDSCTKEEVKSGPEASGRVKITVLEEGVDGTIGEDGRNEFESILVQRIEGNKSIRVVNLCLNLIEGTALLPLVSFIRNKRWMKISRIRLKARFVDDFDGVRVKEAQTEPFVLMDCRNEAYKKHPIPSLHDDIWRLYNIGRNGPLDTSLRQAKIKTVGDFIVRLFLHPRCLEEERRKKENPEQEKSSTNCPYFRGHVRCIKRW